MEKAIAYIYERENGRLVKVSECDLSEYDETELLVFYMLQNAQGRIVVPKRY